MLGLVLGAPLTSAAIHISGGELSRARSAVAAEPCRLLADEECRDLNSLACPLSAITSTAAVGADPPGATATTEPRSTRPGSR